MQPLTQAFSVQGGPWGERANCVQCDSAVPRGLGLPVWLARVKWGLAGEPCRVWGTGCCQSEHLTGLGPSVVLLLRPFQLLLLFSLSPARVLGGPRPRAALPGADRRHGGRVSAEVSPT